MENNRIQILKEILLDLHHGASPENVQAVSYTHLVLAVSYVKFQMIYYNIKV